MKNYYPLSKTEEGIYVSCLEKTDAYNLPNLINLGKNIDILRFKEAVIKVFDAHPYLFTVLFEGEDGKIYKKIKTKRINIPCHTVEKIDIKPTYFKMLDGHLFELEFFKCHEEYYFYFNFHHIIFDGTSINLFINEVFQAYEGKNIDLENYDANKFAQDEEKMLSSKKYDAAKNYFEELIKDTEVDSTPVYDKSEQDISYKNYNAQLEITNEEVKKYTSKHNLKTSSYFLGAFAFLLTKINMDDKALFLTVNNGRNKDLKHSLGMFVKTYPMYVENKDTVLEYLNEVNDEQIESVKNLLYPFSDLLKDLDINAKIIFAYQGDYFYKGELKGKELFATPLERKDGKELLSIELHRDNGKFNIWIEYRNDLYEESTITHLIKLYDQVLKEFLVKEKLDDVNLVSDEEAKLLDSFNQTDLSYIDFDKTILDYFKESVKKYPKNIAVNYNEKEYTYQSVDLISNKIANKLIELGIKKEHVVSILILKSEYIVLASLGVIKSGGAYQPLDPTYPQERKERC